MRYKNQKPMTDLTNCYNCENCIYVGEGGYMCGQNNEIVAEEFVEPTESFYWCNGRRFEPIG